MTVFGKILTFIILVLALAQAGLMVMFHIEAIKLAAKNDELFKSNQAATASIDSLAKDKATNATEREKLTAELRGVLVEFADVKGKFDNKKPEDIEKEKADLGRLSFEALRTKMVDSLKGSVNDMTAQQTAIATLINEKSALDAKHRDDLAKLTLNNADVDTYKAIVTKVSETIKGRDVTIRDLHETNNQLRDEAVNNKVLAKDLKFRNEQMVVQLKESEQEMGRLRTRLVSPGSGLGGPVPVGVGQGNVPGGVAGPGPGGAGGAAMLRNAPNDNLEGMITRTDPSSGFVTLSIGSDAGLTVGHTLEVFRLNPPKYLGTVRIMTAKPNEAVAKPVSKPLGPITPGDRVASKILGG